MTLTLAADTLSFVLADETEGVVSVDDPEILDRAALARLLGVTLGTLSYYRQQSRKGGIYESAPFPEPDGKVGQAPYWRAERADEILKWDVDRPRRGAGGRPKNG